MSRKVELNAKQVPGGHPGRLLSVGEEEIDTNRTLNSSSKYNDEWG